VLETIKVGKVCSTGEISELIINANNLIRLWLENYNEHFWFCK
jgi:hypothetical protein